MSIRLKDVYRIIVEKGIAEDARDREEIDRVLATAHSAYGKLDEDEQEFFDVEKFTNPYADTRIACGDEELEVRGLLVGIDMEVGEVVLADRLRERGEPIDLLLAHHPEGAGYAGLHDVMYMQADLWAAQGVGIAVADALIEPRVQEVRRKVMPANHFRAVDAARLLGMAMVSCHTPADNCVNSFVQRFVDAESPTTLHELVKALRTIPEYADAARKGAGPALIQGRAAARAGRIVVDMTGGTEGPKEVLERLSAAGVGTLVGMHYSEEHRATAEALKLNLVIAGHVASDAIGMNLVLDEIERAAEVSVSCTSGMVRVKRG